MDLEFQKSDFDKLMFRIDDMPDKVDPVEYFPKLKKWPEFSPQLGWPKTLKNKIFRWIVLVYDKESPFRTKVADVMKRKLSAAKYVKLVESFELIDPIVRRILQGQHAEVNRMIVAYVRMHRQSQYALVVGLENMFYEGLFQIQMGEAPKVGNKQITTVQKELEDAVTALLNQDNNAQVRDELFLFVEEERLELRSEDIANVFASGNKPFEKEEIDYR